MNTTPDTNPAPSNEGAPPPAPEGSAPQDAPDTSADANSPQGDGQDTNSTPPATMGDAKPGDVVTASLNDMLSDANRELLLSDEFKGKDINVVLDSFRETQAKLAEKPEGLQVPGEHATTEDWDNFYKALGRPDTVEGYDLKIPEGMPADTPYDSDFAAAFRTWAHDAGLSVAQTQALHDEYVKMASGKFQQDFKALDEKVTKASEALNKKWGDPDSDGYKRNMEMARRAMNQLNIEGSMKDAGVLVTDGEGNVAIADSTFVEALSRVGKSMFAEDNLYSGQATITGNPFSDESENLTKQSQIIKSDPDRARSMIMAAGKKPEQYGLPKG